MGKWKEKPSVCRKQPIPAQSWTSCYVLKRQKEMMRTVLGPAGSCWFDFSASAIQILLCPRVEVQACSV